MSNLKSYNSHPFSVFIHTFSMQFYTQHALVHLIRTLQVVSKGSNNQELIGMSLKKCQPLELTQLTKKIDGTADLS